MNTTGFCDLNVCVHSNIDKTLEKLADYGYRVVAVNQTFDCTNTDSKKKKKGEKKEDPIPEPLNIQVSEDLKKRLTILRRLTVIFQDSNQVYAVTKSPVLKKYDLFALLPLTSNAFQNACMSSDADIISFKPEERLGYKLNRKTYNSAVSRNAYFEIPYAPMIADYTCRKNIIQVAHLYHAIGRSKNIIITSGAESIGLIRSPYDVASIGLLLGLNEMESKFSLSRYCYKVLSRMMVRKTGKFALSIELINNPALTTAIDEEGLSAGGATSSSVAEEEEDEEVSQTIVKKMRLDGGDQQPVQMDC